MDLEEDFSRGDGWLDDDDAALESFLSEDALLDAIRNAPVPETELPELQDYPVPSAGSVGTRPGGGRDEAPAAAVSSSTALPASAAGANSGDALDGVAVGGNHQAESHGVQRFEIEASDAGPKERRTDLERGATTEASRGNAAGKRGKAPGDADAAKSKPVKTFPWQGAAIAAATLLWMLIWGPDFGLSSAAEVKAVPATPQRDPEIRMPSFSDDGLEDDLSLEINATATRRGSIGVERSPMVAHGTNLSALADSGDASGEASSGGSNERGRRGRRRGGKSEMSEMW